MVSFLFSKKLLFFEGKECFSIREMYLWFVDFEVWRKNVMKVGWNDRIFYCLIFRHLTREQSCIYVLYLSMFYIFFVRWVYFRFNILSWGRFFSWKKVGPPWFFVFIQVLNNLRKKRKKKRMKKSSFGAVLG